MISENKEIIYSIKTPVPIVQVTANVYTRWVHNKPASCARPAKMLYSREEDKLLYRLDGGKEEVEMIKAKLRSYAFAA